MKPVRTVARALLATVFVRGGLDAYNNPDRYRDGAQAVVDRLGATLDSIGLPTDPRSLARVTGAVQVVGGLLLATNTAVRPAAIALAGSLIPSTLAGRDVWAREEGERAGQRFVDRPELLKNLGLVGGLLLAAVDTQGRPGLAWRTEHLAEHAQDSVRRAAATTAKETRRAAQSTAREAKRATHLTAKEAKRAAHVTAKETRRAAHLTAKEAKRATGDARRVARTAARETRLAVKAATPGGLLAG
ncbi:DoxX family protein [Planosporangium sp. 12N6]|uniref:DoxX family protein n=1 Tax=Planosporangium spinosum TaxID=3402278 RepID=UPI003CFB7944